MCSRSGCPLARRSVLTRARKAGPPGDAQVTADGHEIEMLDSLLPALHPRAKAGDQVAIDQLVKVLELRLKYKRQRRAEED